MNTFEQIDAVKLDRVPIMSRDRSIPRKEQASLARFLFKKLRIQGLSVTTPRYSMANCVDVRVPELPRDAADYLFEGVDYHNYSFSDMPEAVPARAKHARRWQAIRKVDAILKLAFPNHDDRSDSQTDYFDNPWSVN